MNSRGSVIRPVSALAATVYGLARKTWDSLFPILPGKLRFVAEMHDNAKETEAFLAGLRDF